MYSSFNMTFCINDEIILFVIKVPEEITLTKDQPMITFIMAVATDYTEASYIYYQGILLSISAECNNY